MKKIILLSFLIPFLLGATYYVASDGSGDYNNVSLAISASSDGDVIALRSGDEFRENAIILVNGTKITSYGDGAKPKILGSIERNNTYDWNDEGSNVWASKKSLSITTDFTTHTIYFYSNSTSENARLTLMLGNTIPDGETLYIDTVSFKECDTVPGSALGSELIANPSFETNTAGWGLYANTTNGADTTGSGRTTTAGEFDSGSAGYKVVCINNGTSLSDIQFYFSPVNITSGKYYALTFVAKASSAFTIKHVSLGLAESPYTNFDNYRLTYDIGNIIFNSEDSVGIKCWSETDLSEQGEYWYDETHDLVKIYSTDNPAIYYSDIELAVTRDIIDGSPNHITIENIDFRYGAAHGIGFSSGVYNIIISDCDFYFIGGGDQYGGTSTIRYGNGIESWNNASNILVERCFMKDIYDEAFTCQGESGTINNITLKNNIMDDTGGITFYLTVSGTISNINILHNTILWGDGGETNSQLLAVSNPAATWSNIIIKNNILSCGDQNPPKLLSIYDLDDPNFIIDNNIYYRSDGGTIITEYYGSNNYTYNNFLSYQSATSQDLHSIASDPLLSSSYRLLPGSPAIGAGTDVGVDTDYLGNPRDSSPDIGAMESGNFVHNATIRNGTLN